MSVSSVYYPKLRLHLQETMNSAVGFMNRTCGHALNHWWFQNHLAAFDVHRIWQHYVVHQYSLAVMVQFWRDSLHCFLTPPAFLKKYIILLLSWTLGLKFGCLSWQTYSDTWTSWTCYFRDSKSCCVTSTKQWMRKLSLSMVMRRVEMFCNFR